MSGLSWQSIVVFVIVVCLFLQWQRWKRRARNSERNQKVWTDALYSFGFEVAAAVNSIRANLLDFRQVNPSVAMPEHLDEIENSAKRIANSLKIADDPIAWHGAKKQARASAQETGVPARSPL